MRRTLPCPPGCLAVLLAVTHGWLASALAAQPAKDDPAVATLSVRGTAQLSRPADQLRISIGVVTDAPEAAHALHENSRLMQGVITALEAGGLGEDEYQTGQFRIRPVHEPRPRQVTAEWRPRIIAYEVTNTLHIKTGQIDHAGKIIDAATNAGANTINSISFDLADPRKHRSAAITEATTNAITDAHTLADASSLHLVRIMTIRLDGAQPRPIEMQARAMAGVAMEAAVATPISGGDVIVQATVDIIYEVAPK